MCIRDSANTRGTVMNLDGTTTQTPSSLQESWSQKHWLLQYDLMFGKDVYKRQGHCGLP